MKEFLTSLVGVDTVEQQIGIARQKGGIGSREPYTLERFEFSVKNTQHGLCNLSVHM